MSRLQAINRDSLAAASVVDEESFRLSLQYLERTLVWLREW